MAWQVSDMLVLPQIVISLPCQEETGASSTQAPSSTKSLPGELEETKKWLEVKVISGKAPAESLKLVCVPKILRVLLRLEQRRSAQFAVSFKLIKDTGLNILLRTETFILRGIEVEEQGTIIFEGNQDTLFFVEHALTRNNGNEDELNGDCGVAGCATCMKSKATSATDQSKFRLEHIFEIVSASQERANIPEPPPPPKVRDNQRSLLAALPNDISARVMNYMNPSDLRQLSMTCRWWHHQTQRHGINLRLYPHQDRGLIRMLDREKSPGKCCETAYEAINAASPSQSCYVDMIDGSIYAGAMPSRKDFIGGLFSNEPGKFVAPVPKEWTS